MAFGKRFFSSFTSAAGWKYRLEIFDEGFTGTAYQIMIGKGGPEINYKAGKGNKFSPILSSTLKLPLMITADGNGILLFQWREELRTTLEEKQSYVHLYRTNVTGSLSSVRPLWSGYVLMDLSSDEDEGIPTEFELTATDGLSILKNVDFVQTGATEPYDIDDIFEDRDRFTNWIYFILNLIGAATTDEGAGVNWSYSTSVNWYNDHNAGTAVTDDPLYLTQGGMMMFYSGEVNEDGEVIYEDAPSCYEVLEKIMISWGCRIVYWHHRYHIIQIDGYEIAESGTFAAPDNINTRVYNNSNANTSNNAYLGDTALTHYELTINNNTSAPEYIKKLSGTNYDYSPAYKEVKAAFLIGGDKNYYIGFPIPNDPAGLAVLFYTQQYQINNPASADYIYLEFDLTITHDQASGQNNGTIIGSNSGGAYTSGTLMTWSRFDYRIFFLVRLYDIVTGTIYFMKRNTSGSYVFSSGQCLADEYPYLEFTEVPNGGTKTQTFSYSAIPDAAMENMCTCRIEVNMIDTPAPTNFQSTQQGVVLNMFQALKPASSILPQSSTIWYQAFNQVTEGPEYFGISINNVVNPNVYSVLQTYPIFNPQVLLVNHLMQQWTNAAGGLFYQGSMDQGNPNIGSLVLVNPNSFSGTVLSNTANTSDSYIHDLGSLVWGDTPAVSDPASLEVWDGSAWEETAYAGKWGRATASGTTKFVNLLSEEVLRLSAESLREASMDLVMPQEGKWKSDSSGTDQSQYISPITKIKESAPNISLGVDLESYIFMRGKFNILEDEWDGDWLQFVRNTGVTISASAVDVTSSLSKIINSTLSGTGQLAQFSNINNSGMVLTSTSSAISAATVTSIPINPMQATVLKSGDILTLLDPHTQSYYSLTLTADQVDEDDTLTVSSIEFTIDVPIGSIVFLPQTTAVAQIQHKTTGTIAGMPVDSDDLGPIKYSGGDYTIDADTIIGVDLDYIKILPRDFLANDDNTTYSVAWKDGSGTTGVIPEDGALELFAFVQIPSGKTATTVDVWGSNPKVLNVYVHDVDSGGGMGTAIGTGAVNTQLDITDTASTATNFLVIKITTTATSNRIYGGKVTLIDTP